MDSLKNAGVSFGKFQKTSFMYAWDGNFAKDQPGRSSSASSWREAGTNCDHDDCAWEGVTVPTHAMHVPIQHDSTAVLIGTPRRPHRCRDEFRRTIRNFMFGPPVPCPMAPTV